MPDQYSGFKSHQLFLSLSPLQLNQQIVTEIEKRLGLSLLDEDAAHRVCFANQNAELQDAYKQVFSADDLLDYVYAQLSGTKSDPDLGSALMSDTLIAYPDEPLAFWQQVRLGHSLRQCRH